MSTIDTVVQWFASMGGGPSLTAQPQLGILSRIDLSNGGFASVLHREVEAGYGVNNDASSRRRGTDHNLLKQERDNLRTTDSCQFIATIGGLFVNADISDGTNQVPFVSLVGKSPAPNTIDSMCRGGVSLESWPSNAQRVQFLTAKGVARTQICLYRDDGTHSQGTAVNPANPGVLQDELNNWTQPAANGGLGLTLVKTASDNIGNDFQALPAGPAPTLAVVISASPYFLDNRDALVTAANHWLQNGVAGATRYVVYPLQIYDEGNNPRIRSFANGKSILIGPDFRKACRLLGSLARAFNDGGAGGAGAQFLKMPNITVEKN